MFYLAIVHHDPGSAYGVTFPDVPDCFAAADDLNDLLPNAIAALDDYFADGHKPAAPRGIEDVRVAYAEDLAEGAFLISVPYIHRTAKTVRANLSFDAGLLEAIDAAAERQGLNRSAFVAQAVRREIELTAA